MRPFELVLVSMLFVWLSACEDKESAACAESRQQARDSMQRGQLEDASNFLERARETCTKKSEYDIRRIETLIAQKAERKELREQTERRRADQRLPTVVFAEWVAKERNAVTKNTVGEACAERGSPDYGFCVASRPGSPEMTVRYFKQDPAAFRFALKTDVPLSCQDLGDHRRVRSWTKDATSYELCELLTHELRSLSALLVEAPGENQLFIFSQDYVRQDLEFERLLKSKS